MGRWYGGPRRAPLPRANVRDMAIIKRKRADGSTAYGVVVYDASTSRHLWAGTRDTWRDARRLEATYEPNEPEPELFSAFAAEWLTTRAHVSARTRTKYERATRIASEHFRNVRLDEIGVQEAERYVAVLTGRYAPLTANVYYTVFRLVMRSAVRYGRVAGDATAAATNVPPRKRQRSIHPLTPEQHKLLVAAIRPAHYQDAVRLWPLVGLRSGELFGLQVADVTGTHLLVRRQYSDGEMRRPKTTAGVRDVPLTREARSIVARQVAGRDSGFVFRTTRGEPVELDYFANHVFAPAAAAAGIEARPYDLRHTYATWMLRAGVDVKTLSRLMGHRHASTLLDVYAQWMPGSDIEAANALDSWLPSASTSARKRRHGR